MDASNIERNLYPVSYTHLDVYKRQARNTLEKAILNQSKRLVADADAALDLLRPGDFELE